MHKDIRVGPDPSGNKAWVTYLIPFRIICPDSVPGYSVSLQEINTNQYDHSILSKVVAALPEPHLEHLPLLACFDGGLALPIAAPYNKIEKAINRFNKVLCALSLGGIEVEAIDSRHVVEGALYQGTHIWPVNDGLSLDAHMHAALRTKMASPFDSIVLNQPRTIGTSEMQIAYERGSRVLDAIPNLTPTFLLTGFTEVRYRNWSDALANLWITVEQLTDHLWEQVFLKDPQRQLDHLPKRHKSLLDDTRTWTLAVRQEILWQVGILPRQTYELLFPSRQARNTLVHDGTAPGKEVVLGLYEAVLQLIERAGKTNLSDIRAVSTGPSGEDQASMKEYTFEDWKSVGRGFLNMRQ